MFDASWENLSQTKYFPSALKQLERHIALNIMNVVALGHLKHNGKKIRVDECWGQQKRSIGELNKCRGKVVRSTEATLSVLR
jgi:hypothetical protein